MRPTASSVRVAPAIRPSVIWSCQLPATITTERPVPSTSSSGDPAPLMMRVLPRGSQPRHPRAAGRRSCGPCGRAWSRGSPALTSPTPTTSGSRSSDVDAVRLELAHLLGVVRQQAHAVDAEVREDAGRRAVVASIDRQAECEVRVERVEAVLLQAVRAQLVDEPDAPALVTAQVDDDAARALDRLERGVELRPALALERAERLAREALGVHAHDRAGGVCCGVARDDGDVVGAGRCGRGRRAP